MLSVVNRTNINKSLPKFSKVFMWWLNKTFTKLGQTFGHICASLAWRSLFTEQTNDGPQMPKMRVKVKETNGYLSDRLGHRSQCSVHTCLLPCQYIYQYNGTLWLWDSAFFHAKNVFLIGRTWSRVMCLLLNECYMAYSVSSVFPFVRWAQLLKNLICKSKYTVTDISLSVRVCVQN